MRKAITVALATAVAASNFGFMAATASGAVVVPDGKECSKHEYQRVEHGMSKAKVTQLIGSKGMANYGGEGFTGYLYGGMAYGDLTNTAGCNVAFKQSDHGQIVLSKDGWFPRT